MCQQGDTAQCIHCHTQQPMIPHVLAGHTGTWSHTGTDHTQRQLLPTSQKQPSTSISSALPHSVCDHTLLTLSPHSPTPHLYTYPLPSYPPLNFTFIQPSPTPHPHPHTHPSPSHPPLTLTPTPHLCCRQPLHGDIRAVTGHHSMAAYKGGQVLR